MPNSLTSARILTVSAFTALTLAVLPGISGTADAATSLQNCDGSSRKAVLECCEDHVRRFGAPAWLRQSGGSCTQSIVVCSVTGKAAAVKVCKVVNAKLFGVGGGNGGGGKKGGGFGGFGNLKGSNNGP